MIKVNNDKEMTDFQNYLWSQSFFKCFCLCGCSILVSTADVKCVVVAQATIPCKDISTQNATNDVAKVRDIVDIGQGTGYEYVAFTLEGQAVLR